MREKKNCTYKTYAESLLVACRSRSVTDKKRETIIMYAWLEGIDVKSVGAIK